MASPTIPGYESLTQIGTGGFSRVYQGQQTKLKRVVAIKVLNFGLNDEADRRSFERECELMGRVSTHPNIVTVHDTEFTSDGHPCIVMEHYPGGSLADFIGEVGKLQVRETLEVGVAIAAALEASHQANVLHCDLKPQNILISEFGQPALGDFGISTFAEERTYTGSDAGAGFTLAYAAPEILEGASPSITSDVYSLAATLYTALAGRRPFFFQTAGGERPTPSEQARRILLETAPPLVDFGVPAELDRLIASAMAKDPDHRPQSAADFAVALYEVGSELGLNTSMPRIASQAALRGRLPAQNPQLVDPSVPAEPIIDLTQLTQMRTKTSQVAPPGTDPGAPPAGDVQPPADPPPAPSASVAETPELDATEARVVVPAPAAPEPVAAAPARRPALPPGRSLEDLDGPVRGRSSRTWIAAGFAAASLAAVVVVLFLFSGQGQQGADEAPTVPPVSGSVVDPVIAPNQPTNVELVHMNDNRALVRWTVPGGVQADSDITYEVRRQGAETDPLVTSDALLVIDDVGAGDATCVTVLAVRSNRTSAPTRPACLGPSPTVTVSLSADECLASSCDLDLIIDGAVGGDAQAVLVDQLNTNDFDDLDFAEVDLDQGTFALSQLTEPGLYALVVEWPDQTVATVITVLEPTDS